MLHALPRFVPIPLFADDKREKKPSILVILLLYKSLGGRKAKTNNNVIKLVKTVSLMLVLSFVGPANLR
jgi:hypothetical protein